MMTERSRVIPGLAIAFALWGTALPAQAWNRDEKPRTVVEIGAHNDNTGFVRLAEALPANCAWGVLYFNLTTPVGRAIYATFVAARSTGHPVRVGYLVPDAPGMCTVGLASLAQP